MSHLNPYLVGLSLLVGGLLLWGLTRLALRTLARRRSPHSADTPASAGDLHAVEDGILILQSGGRLAYINASGRRLFNLSETANPDLERLARQMRPIDQFYSLCAREGQATLLLAGKLLNVSSYTLPSDDEPFQVLALRPVETDTALARNSGEVTSQTLQTVLQLAEAMAGNLDMNATLQAILENTAKLVPADLLEITLWDEGAEQLIPYRLYGGSDGPRQVEMARDRYHPDEGYSGYLASRREALLITDVLARRDLTPSLKWQAFPLRAYLGVPLLVGNELMGTLEMGSLTSESFHEEDLRLVRLISGQAAIALHNARLYQQEQRRAAELAGLAEVAQAFGGVGDPHDLFNRLVQNISTLISVQIIGFLLYNENTRMLEGQLPFKGLPAQIVEMYRVAAPASSPLERILLEQDCIISENASEDPRWEAFGMAFIAQAASMRETVLMPVASGGRILGYLVASNREGSGSSFTQDELHLLMIVANQAAPVIENATLVTQARQRAQRSEGLRRITSLASSAATLGEILQYSLVELVRLLQADYGFVYLMDEERTSLHLNKESACGDLPALPDKVLQLKVEDPQYPFSVTGSQHTLNSGNLISEKAILPFYQPLLNSCKLLSAVAVPLTVRSEGIGELWICSQHPDFFDHGDVQVVATAAGQLAGVVERTFLIEQTDESLRRRVEQLTALTRITRELSTSLDLKYLLQLVYDESVRTTRADCGTIQLFDLEPVEGLPVQPRFFVGDEPNDRLSPLEQQIVASREPLNILDVSYAQVELPHDLIRSMLLVPIVYQDRPAGLISLHSSTVARFDDSALEIAQALADQAALAFGNAIQYEDQLRHGAHLTRELETVSELFQVTQVLRPDLPLKQALEAIASAIRQATPFQMVLISLYEEGLLRREIGLGLSPEAWEELRTHKTPWQAIAGILQPEFCQKQAFFIPSDRLPVVPAEIHTVTVLPNLNPGRPDSWDPDDMLLVPLYGAGGQPLGLISVDAPKDERRPDRPTIEALELFASQAALVIENQQNIGSLLEQTANLKSQLAQLEQKLPIEETHQEFAPTQEVVRLRRQASLMQSSLSIAEQAGKQPDVWKVLDAITQALLSHFDMQLALVGEMTPAGPKLSSVVGKLPENFVPEALFGQQNPLRLTLQDGLIRTITDLPSASEWNNCSLLTGLSATSFITLPFFISAERRFAVLAVGRSAMPALSMEEQVSLEDFSRQAAASLRNVTLLNETRRRLAEVNLLLEFTRKLGSLDPINILNTLVGSVLQIIHAAEAGWVALWDPNVQQLRIQAAAGYPSPDCLLGTTFSAYGSSPALPVRVRESGQAERLGEVHFASVYPLPAQDLMNYRQATAGRLPVSCLAVPISLGGEASGVLMLENFNLAEAFHADDETISMALTQQTALALENAHLLEETRQLTADLERRVEERTAELSKEHHNSQTLLESITELSASLDLTQVLSRTLAVLNGSTGAQQGLILLARGSQVFKAGEPLALMGRTGLLGDQQPERQLAEWVMKERDSVIVDQISADPRWEFPPDSQMGYSSVMAVPLKLGEDVLGTLLLLHREVGFFVKDQIGLMEAVARQISIALNNAELFNLIRDQAEHLGSMLRDQQIEASRSRAILEAVADGVVVTDENNQITLFNASAERILDLDSNRVIGHKVDQFSGLFGPQTSVWMQTVRAWSEDVRDFQPGETYAEQMTLENGKVVSIHLSPVMWRSDFLGTVSIFRDITHEVQVDRLKTEFVANVSHELRTPLTSIKGYVEVLLIGAAGKLNDQQAHFLQVVQQNTARLQILVNDLLDISRIESGQISLSFQPVRLPYLVEEVLADLRRRSQDEKKPMQFECEIPTDLPEVLGDSSRVRQVLANLVTNSYNYTPADGCVQVKLLRENGHVQVNVQDNGIGIALKDQERIFERFYRGEDTLVLATAGTGLGLAIAKILIEMHHGKIWFTSSGVRGEGATFSFTLPVIHTEE